MNEQWGASYYSLAKKKKEAKTERNMPSYPAHSIVHSHEKMSNWTQPLI